MAMTYRILSIDGGGIRGIVPATVLARLEDICERPIAQLFDLIVGTSTGGILALALTAPGRDGSTPAYQARDLLKLYETEGPTIFPAAGTPGWTQRIFGTSDPSEWLRNPIGILNRSAQRAGAPFGGNVRYAGGSRYFVKGLDDVLNVYVGNAALTSAITDVLVTSYDMAYDEPVIFSSRTREGCISEVQMRVAARATSAGPTYFEPQPLVENGKQRVLVDGGVCMNNPAMLAYLVGARAAGARPIALLSLGTGTRNAAKPRTVDQVKKANWLGALEMVMQAAMGGGAEVADAALSVLLAASGTYWRMQTTVGTCNFAMDDSSASNVECLKQRALELVAANENALDAIRVELLKDGR